MARRRGGSSTPQPDKIHFTVSTVLLSGVGDRIHHREEIRKGGEPDRQEFSYNERRWESMVGKGGGEHKTLTKKSIVSRMVVDGHDLSSNERDFPLQKRGRTEPGKSFLARNHKR